MIKPEGDDNYLISFFVPDCSLQVKRSAWNSGLEKNDFGEYLRRCEKSDHMDWNDESKHTIVTNIKSQVVKKIHKAFIYGLIHKAIQLKPLSVVANGKKIYLYKDSSNRDVAP